MWKKNRYRFHYGENSFFSLNLTRREYNKIIKNREGLKNIGIKRIEKIK